MGWQQPRFDAFGFLLKGGDPRPCTTGAAPCAGPVSAVVQRDGTRQRAPPGQQSLQEDGKGDPSCTWATSANSKEHRTEIPWISSAKSASPARTTA